MAVSLIRAKVEVYGRLRTVRNHISRLFKFSDGWRTLNNHVIIHAPQPFAITIRCFTLGASDDRLISCFEVKSCLLIFFYRDGGFAYAGACKNKVKLKWYSAVRYSKCVTEVIFNASGKTLMNCVSQ